MAIFQDGCEGTMTDHTMSSSNAKIVLFDQEDSGLGSLPSFCTSLNSFDLDACNNINMVGHNSQTTDPAQTHAVNKYTCTTLHTGDQPDHNRHHQRDSSSASQPTQLLSLTDQMLNLNIVPSPKDITCKYSDASSLDTPNTDPGSSKSSHIRQSDNVMEEWCDSGFGADSGIFSINASSATASAPSSSCFSCNGSQQEELAPTKNSLTIPSLPDITVQCHPDCEHNTPVPRFISNLTPHQRIVLYEGDQDGDNWLHLSIINKCVDLALEVISHAPDYVWLSFSNMYRQTPLHLAVLTNQPLVVRRLICAGATVDAQDMNGDTPLHLACRMGLETVISHFLTPVTYEETTDNAWEIPYQRLPQDLSITNSEGLSPLHLAVLSSHKDVAQLLLDAGADPNMGEAKSGRTSLHLAVQGSGVQLVQMLADRPETDITRGDYAGLTAAHLAWGRGDAHIANILLGDYIDNMSDSDSDMTLVDSDTESLDEGMQ